MAKNPKQDAKTEPTSRPSKDEYRMFRDDLEALSEKVGLIRNHFYNHSFKDGTLLKESEVQSMAKRLHKLAQLHKRCLP
jgi:hypothetical protein